MAKRKGINTLYLSAISSFLADYEAEAIAMATVIKSAKRDVKDRLNKMARERLTPLIDKMFTDSVAQSNRIVKADISKLTDQINVPFKYNKDMLTKINGDSVFTGFYDTQYKSLYSKREIDALKRTILTGKYSGMSDRELAASIRNTINTTKKRALLTARSETTRLESAANEIYFSNASVRKEYDLVWQHNSDYDRHKHMSGVKANVDGKFYDSKTGGLIPAPPYVSSPWNCLCSTRFIKK